MRKKMIAICLTMLMALMTPMSAFAITFEANQPTATHEVTIESLSYEELKDIADYFAITAYELANLANILEYGIEELQFAKSLNAMSGMPLNTVSVQVSENLILTSTVSETIDRNDTLSAMNVSLRRTITATMTLHNIFGATIVTLNSIGIFITNDTNATISDRIATFNAFGWNVTTDGSQGGSGSRNARVRNNFDGSLRLGTDSINIT
jgi:hypothetical protein